MLSLRIAAAVVAVAAAFLALSPGAWNMASASELTAPHPAPEISDADHWLNSPPLSIQKLHGKVVLVEFWARECINCIHVIPHTRELYDKYAKDGLVVVGVHTPEYNEERDIGQLKEAIRQYGITWPVAVDTDYKIWNAYGNQFWPAIYLIDRDGKVVYQHFGEGNYEETEQRVRELLGKS